MSDERPEKVICGHRETRTTGTYECVMPPEHKNRAHYFVMLIRIPQEKS